MKASTTTQKDASSSSFLTVTTTNTDTQVSNISDASLSTTLTFSSFKPNYSEDFKNISF